jgi:hypothetical protein
MKNLFIKSVFFLMTLSQCIYSQKNIAMEIDPDLHDECQILFDMVKEKVKGVKEKVKKMEMEGVSSKEIVKLLKNESSTISNLIDRLMPMCSDYSISMLLNVMEAAVENNMTKPNNQAGRDLTEQQKTFFNIFRDKLEKAGNNKPDLAARNYMLYIEKERSKNFNDEREFSQILDLELHKKTKDANVLGIFLADLKKLRNRRDLVLVIGEELHPDKQGRFKQGGNNIYVFLAPDREELAHNCFEQGRIGIHAIASDLQLLCNVSDAKELFDVIIDDIGCLSGVIKYSSYRYDTVNIETLYNIFVFLTKPGGLIITDPMAYGQILLQNELLAKLDIKLSNKLEKPGIDTQDFDKVNFSETPIWKKSGFNEINEVDKKIKQRALDLYNVLFKIPFSEFCSFQPVPNGKEAVNDILIYAPYRSKVVIFKKIIMYCCFVNLEVLKCFSEYDSAENAETKSNQKQLYDFPVGYLVQEAAKKVSEPGIGKEKIWLFAHLINSVASIGACAVLPASSAEKLASDLFFREQEMAVTEILIHLFGKISLVLKTHR